MWPFNARYDLQYDKLVQDITNAVTSRLKEVDSVLTLGDEVIRLKTEINDLKISKSLLIEEQEKREREIQHKLGLERNRQEQEAKNAKEELKLTKRDALVSVKEENLVKNQERFETQMEFITNRFLDETKYLKEIMKSILDARLPSVIVKK